VRDSLNRAPAGTDLIEISIQTDCEAAEAVSAVMGQYGIGGAAIEEVFPSDPGASRTVRVKAYLLSDRTDQLERIELALWHLSRIQPIPEPQIRILKRADWEESWKSGYTVQHIGLNIVVKPSWLTYQAQSGEITLELDPGVAFGTGLHPSTQLVLEAMERHLQPGSVLDVGTGSGILSIAAAKMGARVVHALEIDDLAIRVAQQNIQLNGVDTTIQVHRATLTPVRVADWQGEQPAIFNAAGEFNSAFGTVLMNILAEVIAASAAKMADCLAASGRFIVSGIIEPREEVVLRALEAAGLVVNERLQRTDWVALVGSRRELPAAGSQ
jgi:ribosomal protein L11 methyltransferase